MPNLEINYQTVLARLNQACEENNRNPSSVRLLAVSKTKPAGMVEQLYHLGQRHFGENYVQEGCEKTLALTHLPSIEWHFIGALQSNKTRLIAEHFDWLETLDRIKIAERLNNQRPKNKAPLNVLIQVNISQEPQKSGIPLADVIDFSKQIKNYPNIKLRGLMCIAEATDDTELLSSQFRQMQQTYKELQNTNNNIDTLSMGMSSDMSLAIACGSTEIRIGTDIFGARS